MHEIAQLSPAPFFLSLVRYSLCLFYLTKKSKLGMEMFNTLVEDEDHAMAFGCVTGPRKVEWATKWKCSIFAHLSQELQWWQRRAAAAGRPRLKHCCVATVLLPHFWALASPLDAKNTCPLPLFLYDCVISLHNKWPAVYPSGDRICEARCTRLFTPFIWNQIVLLMLICTVMSATVAHNLHTR